MSKIIIKENGKIRDVGDVELAEKVTEMRKKEDPWKVIDQLMRVWAKNVPDEVEAIRINVDEYREVQQDKEFAQTKNGKDFERRFQLAFPRQLMLMIRSQYKAEELPMDREFFKEFATRYPFFKVAEKS
jgi:hypothetical protein